jgi:hypothetical protein
VRSPASGNDVAASPSAQLATGSTWRRRLEAGLLALTVVALLARFVGLERSPPGFFYDEATAATHAICLAREGTSATGERLPFLFEVKERQAFHYAPFIYAAAPWVQAFGTSPGVLRMLSALSSCLAILGLALLARRFTDRSGVLFVTFAAATLPWSFHFARIFWDGAIMPCLLVWSLYFFVRSERSRDLLASAVLAGLAVQAYSPARLVVPLAFAPLLLARLRKGHWGAVLAFSAVVSLLVLPIAAGMWSGQIQSRFRTVTILTPEYLESHYGSTNPLLYPWAFAVNFLVHLSPGFLFTSGDRSLRHSTGYIGITGWLGAFALLGGLWLAWQARGRDRPAAADATRRSLGLVAWWAAAGLCGGAGTWESIPHSLRASAAWPFAALLMGLAFRGMTSRRVSVLGALLALGCVQTIYFAWIYFGRYPADAHAWFDVAVTETAKEATLTGGWDGFLLQHRDMGPSPLRYFLIHYANVGCVESVERAGRVLH